MRRDAFVDAGLPRGQAHGLPDHLRGDRRISPPAVVRPREEIGARSHPAVVLAQRREQRWTEGDLAIAAALALLDPEHHALAIDVTDFELARFAAAPAGAIQRQEHRAVIEILCARDETLDLVGAEHDGQAVPPLRIRQVLAHVTPFEDISAEEPEGGDLGGPRSQWRAAVPRGGTGGMSYLQTQHGVPNFR